MKFQRLWKRYSRKEKYAFVFLILFFFFFSHFVTIRSYCTSSPCSRLDSSHNVGEVGQSDYLGDFVVRPLFAPTMLLAPMLLRSVDFEVEGLFWMASFDDVNEVFTPVEGHSGSAVAVNLMDRSRMTFGYVLLKMLTIASLPFWMLYAAGIVWLWKRRFGWRLAGYVFVTWIVLSSTLFYLIWTDQGSQVRTWSYLLGFD